MASVQQQPPHTSNHGNAASSSGPGSAVSSPRAATTVSLMCSFGGRILLRPHDHQLRYVGGETRIVSVPRPSSFLTLLSRFSKLLAASSGCTFNFPPAVKYQLPNEDLDALISLTSDEDVENMFDEYDRLAAGLGRIPRLRLFLFSSPSSSDAPSSVASSPPAPPDQWFVDALNGSGVSAGGLERGRSEGEASSVVTELPDYLLFGLETDSDEPVLAKPKKDGPSSSEPGSPFSAASQPFVQPLADLSPFGYSKPVMEENREIESIFHSQQRFIPYPVWSYMPGPLPVYYMPASVQGGSLARQVSMPVQIVASLGAHVQAGYQWPVAEFVDKPAQNEPVIYMARPANGQRQQAEWSSISK